MPNFNESTPLSIPHALPLGVGEATRETPAFTTQAIGVAICLPLGAGLLAFVGVGCICFALGESVRVAIGTAGAAVLVAGTIWMLDAKSIMFGVETITGQDLNRGGQIGTPQKPTISVMVSEPIYNRSATFDLPGTEDAFGRLVRGVLLGRPLSEAHWCGRGKPYSKAEFAELCEALEQRGIVRWRDDKARAQGRELTRAGKAVFQSFAEAPEIARNPARASNGGALLESGEEE